MTILLLEDLRREIIDIGIQLKEYKLITLTGGNVSGRDSKTELIAITPSGMEYDKLKPEDIVIVNIDGKIVDGLKKPSSDLMTHLQIYRKRKDINGIIHTHSVYASCFAMLNENVPVISTTMANEVGGEVPVAKYAPVASEEMGENILKVLGNQKAVLLQNHGVFTFGKNPHHALVAAVMFEDSAKVYYLARTIGRPVPMPEKEVKIANDYFQNVYGQR